MKTFVCGDILLDEEDKYLLEKYKFWLKDDKYLQTSINNKTVYIHHIIMNTNSLIDHIDRNPLNNKKSNLRIATKSTNAMNSKLRLDNTSGIKGVSWNKQKSKWEVYINKDNTRIRLGYYKNLKDAAFKRVDAELMYFKEYCNKELISEIIKKYG